MTDQRARATADFFDQREYDRWLVERSPDSFWRGLAGLGAGLIGGLPDPINFIPVFGPAARAAMIARFGRLGGRALTGAAEVGLLTAAEEPLIVYQANRLGDDMTLAEAGLDIAMGVGTGFLLGGTQGVWRSVRSKPARALRLPSVRAQAAALLDEATQAVARGESPRLSPSSLAAAGETIAREADIRPAPVDADPAGRSPGIIEIDPGDRRGLVQWIRAALVTPGNQLRGWLGTVSQGNARAVAEQAGVDIGGYRRVWEQSCVRHVDNRHGPGSIGVRNGELPMTPEDMALYREIVDAPDRVERTVTDRGQPSLLYEKKLGDWYYYVEEVRAGRRTLALNTMYRRPTPDPTKFGRRDASDGPGAPPAAAGSPRGIRPEPAPARTTAQDIAPSAAERQAPGGEGCR